MDSNQIEEALGIIGTPQALFLLGLLLGLLSACLEIFSILLFVGIPYGSIKEKDSLSQVMCLICAIIFILSIPTIILPILCLIIYGFAWCIYKRCPQKKDDACLLKMPDWAVLLWMNCNNIRHYRVVYGQE